MLGQTPAGLGRCGTRALRAPARPEYPAQRCTCPRHLPIEFSADDTGLITKRRWPRPRARRQARHQLTHLGRRPGPAQPGHHRHPSPATSPDTTLNRSLEAMSESALTWFTLGAVELATPARIGSAELDAAVDRIHRRHRDVDDPHRRELSDDPAQIISYLLQHASTMPPQVVEADLRDALVLWVWCWWQERQRERQLLEAAHAAGLSLAELGAELGIGTRGGLRHRLDRLHALLQSGRPDQARGAGLRGNTSPEQAWLDAHRAEVHHVLAALLAQVDRIPTLRRSNPTAHPADDRDQAMPPAEPALLEQPPDDDSWLDDLDDLRDAYLSDRVTSATMALAGLIIQELRVRPEVRALDPRHRLHTALRAVPRLRADIARDLAAPPASSS